MTCEGGSNGRVAREIAPPGHPQISMCSFLTYG
jgi:hypothetical protein